MPQRFSVSIALSALAVALAVGGCAHKPMVVSQSEANYFGTSKVHRYQLANGLKILILEDHSAPTFAYQTWYNVGSRDESPGRTGLAHFFEHMMFKDTQNHKEGELHRILETAGAEGENAFTSQDYTAYVQSLPSDKFELVAGLESDRMVNLLVKEESVNKEREVVQNERRFRTENNPNGLMYEKLYELAYAKHSYHWPVIGYDVDLRNASRQDFENFYKRFYAPNDATVVVAGDVDPAKILPILTKYYGKLSASKMNRKPAPQEPLQTAERIEYIPIKSPVEKLIVGYHIADAGSPDFPTIEAAREILAGGKGSRLYRRLVDGGIATSVELESSEQKDPGLLMIFLSLQKGKTSKQALALIDHEIKDMAAGHIKTEEIDRALSMHRFVVFDELASNYSKAQFLGFYETVAGNFERGVQIVNSLTSVDKGAIANVLKTYFRKENRTVVIGTATKESQ